MKIINCVTVRKHYLILNEFYLIYLVLYDFKINKVRICEYKKAFLIER